MAIRSQSLAEKRDYDARIDTLLDYVSKQEEEMRELRLENAVLRSLVPDDIAKALELE